MIQTNTLKEKQETSIIYECRVSGSMNPENIVSNKPLMKLGAIGLPLNYAYMEISYIKHLIEKTCDDVKDRIYEIIDTTNEVASVVSYQALHHVLREGEQMHHLYRSASHCQEGQGGKLYKLRKIKNAGKIVQNTIIKGIATKRRKTKTKNIGGKRKTKKI